ncbi:hypothetical protein AU79_22260 [Salmonella enterica subsp. enterica serovar Enteritidis str. SA19940857]|nr:hypothetical protein AU79_22260 [Salmonella enterica subsp. enterica serovar Enteritidis str. SA19940857]
MPKEAKEKAEAELQKLKMMSPMSAEATVVRGYIDWMVQVPWNARSKVKKDLRQAQEILDTDHYGLERVKDRIVNASGSKTVRQILAGLRRVIGQQHQRQTFFQNPRQKFRRTGYGYVVVHQHAVDIADYILDGHELPREFVNNPIL